MPSAYGGMQASVISNAASSQLSSCLLRAPYALAVCQGTGGPASLRPWLHSPRRTSFQKVWGVQKKMRLMPPCHSSLRASGLMLPGR